MTKVIEDNKPLVYWLSYSFLSPVGHPIIKSLLFSEKELEQYKFYDTEKRVYEYKWSEAFEKHKKNILKNGHSIRLDKENKIFYVYFNFKDTGALMNIFASCICGLFIACILPELGVVLTAQESDSLQIVLVELSLFFYT